MRKIIPTDYEIESNYCAALIKMSPRQKLRDRLSGELFNKAIYMQYTSLQEKKPLLIGEYLVCGTDGAFSNHSSKVMV